MSTSWVPSIKSVRNVCGVICTTSDLYFKGRKFYYVDWKQQPYPPLSPGEELLEKVAWTSGVTLVSCGIIEGVRCLVERFSSLGTQAPKSDLSLSKNKGLESCLSQDPLNPHQGSSYVDEQILNQENNSTININSSIEVPDPQILQEIGTRNDALPNQIFRKSIKN